MRLTVLFLAALAILGEPSGRPAIAADPPPAQPAARGAPPAKSERDIRAEKGWQESEESSAGEAKIRRIFVESFTAENNIGTEEMIMALSVRCYPDRKVLINFMTTVNLATLDQIQRYEPFTIEWRVDGQRRTAAPGSLVLPQVMMFKEAQDAQAFVAAAANARRSIEVDAVTRVVRMPGRFAATNAATALKPVVEGCGRPPTS